MDISRNTHRKSNPEDPVKEAILDFRHYMKMEFHKFFLFFLAVMFGMGGTIIGVIGMNYSSCP